MYSLPLKGYQLLVRSLNIVSSLVKKLLDVAISMSTSIYRVALVLVCPLMFLTSRNLNEPTGGMSYIIQDPYKAMFFTTRNADNTVTCKTYQNDIQLYFQ